MGKIIQRDFFPDLEKLKAQNEYLDAISTNDIVKLREIYSKYSMRRLSSGSASPFDTPVAQPNISSSVRSNQSNSSSLSRRTLGDYHTLDTFFNKYTSEDNQSFEEILEAAEEKLRQKFAVLYNAEDSSANVLKNSLALPSIANQFESTERPNKLDSWTYKNKNYLMYTPDGVEFTQKEKIEMAKRKMEIEHCNTRLNSKLFDDSKNKEAIAEAAKNNAKGNPEKIGLDGKTLEQELPGIRGFNFV